MRKSTLLICCLLVLNVVATADEWNKTFKISAKPELRVNAHDGSVELSSWDNQEIEVRVETTGWRIASDQVRVSDRQSGDRVEIELLTPHWSWHFYMGRRSVRMLVKVPRQSDLDIHTADGSIRASDLKGQIRLDSGDGSIHASELRGDLRVHTGDGAIDLARVDGTLNADTGDGQVNVSGRFDVLKVRTGDGSIRAVAEGGSQISDGWSFLTGDGNVELRLPEGFTADLDARTGDGSIDVDFPVLVTGSHRRDQVRGKINGGGPLLQIRTGDGSVRLSHS